MSPRAIPRQVIELMGAGLMHVMPHRPNRSWNVAQVLHIRGRVGPSHPGVEVASPILRLINVHFPSSKRKKLSNTDITDGMQSVRDFMVSDGSFFGAICGGDFNVPETRTFAAHLRDTMRFHKEDGEPDAMIWEVSGLRPLRRLAEYRSDAHFLQRLTLQTAEQQQKSREADAAFRAPVLSAQGIHQKSTEPPIKRVRVGDSAGADIAGVASSSSGVPPPPQRQVPGVGPLPPAMVQQAEEHLLHRGRADTEVTQ